MENRLPERLLRNGGKERALSDEVVQNSIVRDRSCIKGESVKHRRGPQRRIRSENGGREWNERRNPKQQQIQQERRTIDALDRPKQHVVIVPHDADDRKTEDVSQKVRPQSDQCLREFSVLCRPDE